MLLYSLLACLFLASNCHIPPDQKSEGFSLFFDRKDEATMGESFLL